MKVHYYRPDGNYGDWEVHMWNGSGVSTVSSTREFEVEEVEYEGTTYGVTATYYTNSNETWVGFIVKKPDWTKDPDGDRHIDISDVLSGTVHVYAKSGSALEDFDVVKDDCVKGAKITGAKWDSLTEILTVTTSMAVEGDLMEAFALVEVVGKDETPIEITSVTKVEGENAYILGYPEGAIAKDKAYRVYFNGASCDVTIPNTYSTKEFEAQYTYTGDDLGATWTAESTTFRVWAPTAAEVFVNLYTAGEGGEKIGSVGMTADVNGTWVATVEGDLNGTYYTYSVNVQGKVAEAVDPYARTTGVNGNRGMVIDLDSTDPEGWENDTYVTQDNYTDAVIWELHVRDFSIDESSGMENKGKYLAFTEEGTTIPGTDISTGIDYMVDLGVNYVHLLPVYDINSVDETSGGYNWGYDPKNYNVPEGSYSTDPYNGAVRVNEFKQMVQSLHDNGIGVIMDVVYNHVADAGQFCFNQIVPGYFSRIHDDGSYQSNSGCGNDTATERSMVSKYIVDSVLYWCEEYHIDGFRWDLVGLIDYETINAVMEEVHKVNPDIIFYGEGWEMCSWTTKDEGDYASDPYSKKMTIQPNDHLVNTDAGVFAFFNDTIRNVIHGGVFTATDKGFVVGNMNEGTKQTVTLGYMGNSNWGSNNASVDTPLQTINYASCHDNYTLFDNFTVDSLDLKGLALSAENANAVAEQAAAYNKLAAAYYITAQGVPFIHAGEEMLRSKPTADAEGNFVFDHNSYSSGDAINSIKWYTLSRPLVSDAVDYYTGLIAFRKAHPALRMTDEAAVLAAMSALQTGNNNLIAILNKGGNGENAQILTIINADGKANAFTLPEGQWNVYVNKDDAGTEILETVEGTVEVAATSAMILVKEEETSADPAPEKPVKIENLIAGVRVRWNAVEGASQYGVWRSENGKDGEYKWIGNTDATTYTDKDVQSGKTYYYKVTTVNGEEHSEKSEALGIIFISTPDIIARSNQAAGISLTWNKVEGATGYAVYRKNLEGNDAWVRIATIEGNDTFTWMDTSVKNANGSAYKYTVRALAGNMNIISGCHGAGRTMVRLSSRVLNSAVKSGADGVKCSWSTSSAVMGYEIRFMVDGEVYQIFTVEDYKTGVKTFTGLEAGATYKIQVRSYVQLNGMNFYSAWSVAKNVTL